MSKNNQNSQIDDSFLEIDEGALDREWVRQPKLYFKFAMRLALARSEFDEAKADFELVKADLDSAIRDDPTEYGLKKLTEPGVVAAMPRQGQYIKALQDINEKRRAQGILEAAVTALEHKKRALEKLVDLHGQEYFSTPRAPANSREAVDNMEKQAARTKRRRDDD